MNLNAKPQFYIHPDFLELHRYLGPRFNLNWCTASDQKGEDDANSGNYSDNQDFIRNSIVFVYQSIGLMAQGIHRPYIAKILECTADMGSCSILEYGAGGGQMGLALHTLGYRVSFADLYSQSLLFLLWRLRERRLDLPIYVLGEGVIIPHHDIVICFDVIEHCELQMQLDILDKLAEIGSGVFVNLIRGDGGENPGLHFEVDVEKLTEHVCQRHKCWFGDYYEGKQRLLIYGDAVDTLSGVTPRG